MADPTTSWEDDLAAALNEDAEAPPVMEDSPSTDSAPADDPADDSPVDEVLAEALDDEPVTAADPVIETEAESQTETEPHAQTPQIDWDAADNPYRTQAEQNAQKATQFDQMQQLLRIAQQQRAQQAQAERIRNLADDDPMKATELQHFIAETHQPLTQQIDSLNSEVETVAKAATVLDAAMRLYVPPELQTKIDAEVERLMKLPGGYSVLQNHIDTRISLTSEAQAEIAAIRAENETLRKRLAAKQTIAERQAAGADVVDSGSGTGGSFEKRWESASNFDEAFDAIVSEIPELRPTG